MITFFDRYFIIDKNSRIHMIALYFDQTYILSTNVIVDLYSALTTISEENHNVF